MRGFKNAQGAAEGQNLRAKWQDAWDNWGGKDSEDPNAFNTFFQTFVKDNVGTEDPDVLAGVLPAVEALQANATTQYTQYRHDQTVRGSLTSNGAVISGTVQEGLEDGLVQEKGTDYPAIFNRVNKVVADSLASLLNAVASSWRSGSSNRTQGNCSARSQVPAASWPHAAPRG